MHSWQLPSFVPQAYAAVPVPQPGSACDPSQNAIDLSTCLTLDGTRPVASVFATPADLINVIVNFLFVVGGVLLFITIFYSGFKFIRSGTKGKDEAKSMLTTAMIGFIIMFVAYWIVRIVEVLIGTEIIF